MIEWIIIPAIVFGGFAILAIITFYRYKGLKRRDQERIEAVIRETEDLGEEVLGRIRVLKLPKFSPLGEMPLIHEVLVITANSVFVERIAEETPPSVPGGVLDDVIRHVKRRRKSEAKKSFAIPKADITRVWLKKFGWKGRKVKLKVITTEKEYEWGGNGLVLPDGWKTDVELEDYEKILRLAFPDKLSVGKEEYG